MALGLPHKPPTCSVPEKGGVEHETPRPSSNGGSAPLSRTPQWSSKSSEMTNVGRTPEPDAATGTVMAPLVSSCAPAGAARDRTLDA